MSQGAYAVVVGRVSCLYHHGINFVRADGAKGTEVLWFHG